jgi:peroxiredoxin
MPHDGCAGHLRQGLQLPPIPLSSTSGGTVTLAAEPGRILLLVYPWSGRPGRPNPPGWDDIPGAHGSTPELEGFRDRHAAFVQRGLEIFGLSAQTTAYQRELVERLQLPFPILSDARGRFAAALGLPTFSAGGTVYLRRLTLLLENGTIRDVFYPIADPAAHAAALLRALDARP